MTPEELADFIARYFRDWRVVRSGSRGERVAREHDLDSPAARLDAMLSSPASAENAWPIVLALVQDAPDEEAPAYVAAGPLEDLIRQRGAQFGDRVVEQARQDERFREALLGVWGIEEISEPLRGRLLALIGAGDMGPSDARTSIPPFNQ
jgi:hypothetical protein